MTKRILFLLCCVLAAAISGVNAEEKVVQKSSKKVPGWMTSHPEGYLIVTVDAPTIAKAQELAMEQVRRRIIESVATNITSTVRTEDTQTTINGNVDSSEKFESISKVTAANLPFIKDISETKIEDIYWEKLQNKQTKRESYTYSIKYPFSRSELKQLQAEFDALESDKTSQLKALEANIGSVSSASEIKEAVGKLDELSTFFFDDTRLKQCETLRARYNSLYADINMTWRKLDGDNRYLIYFTLQGRAFQVTTVPKVTSECASQIQVKACDQGFIVTCDTQDCLPDEENTLEATVRINGKSKKCTINLN